MTHSDKEPVTRLREGKNAKEWSCLFVSCQEAVKQRQREEMQRQYAAAYENSEDLYHPGEEGADNGFTMPGQSAS